MSKPTKLSEWWTYEVYTDDGRDRTMERDFFEHDEAMRFGEQLRRMHPQCTVEVLQIKTVRTVEGRWQVRP
jgi:hypothetical protein